MSGAISLRRLAAGDSAAIAAFADHMSTRGICYIDGRDLLDPELQAKILSVAAAFFRMPDAVKRETDFTGSGNLRGYVGFREERTNGVADLKESFEFAMEQAVPTEREARPYDRLYGRNIWPSRFLAPEFEVTLTRYNRAVDRIGEVILNTMVMALYDATTEVSCRSVLQGRPCHFSRLIYYGDPSMAGAWDDRLVAHTDHAFFAMGLQSASGLEFRNRAGEWELSSPPEGCFVVFPGELAGYWSGGRYAPCHHRVHNAALRTERVSVTTFFLPNLDAVVRPIGAPEAGTSIIVGEREWARMRDIFEVSEEMPR